MRFIVMALDHALRILKHGLYSLLFNLKSFFFLTYPMLQLLCGLGTGIGLLLSFTPSNVKESGSLVALAFICFSLYLFLQKKYYQRLLAWSDARSSNVVRICNIGNTRR
ncbi:hypothetical protein MD588_13405 [Photobacterium sp. SDRW27]|uniref:hypothetical protein n=1 Tax=Photobacterium obscurum TaxID=2829490 RepID=UPI002242FE05|nr:hypothetical protein [Photobacterium obscurum]MCW8329805.1 hypothetical protein [Photobacterium obscurum]